MLEPINGVVPTKKRYYSRIPGSKYCFPDGFEIQFAHGFYEFDPENFTGSCNIAVMNGNPIDSRSGKPKWYVYQTELDELVARGNPLIFVQGTAPEDIQTIAAQEAAKSAKSEVEIRQGDMAMANVKGNVTGDLNTGTNIPGVPTDVNQSTVDPALQNAILKQAKPVGPGASKLEQMRAEAAARTVAAGGAAGTGPA